jgi:hypothetical protein
VSGDAVVVWCGGYSGSVAGSVMLRGLSPCEWRFAEARLYILKRHGRVSYASEPTSPIKCPDLIPNKLTPKPVRQASLPRTSQLILPTAIDPNSFYGKIRTLYADQVLYTQLQQMRKQGSYDAFDLKWQEVYNVRPLKGARTRVSSSL